MVLNFTLLSEIKNSLTNKSCFCQGRGNKNITERKDKKIRSKILWERFIKFEKKICRGFIYKPHQCGSVMWCVQNDWLEWDYKRINYYTT